MTRVRQQASSRFTYRETPRSSDSGDTSTYIAAGRPLTRRALRPGARTRGTTQRARPPREAHWSTFDQVKNWRWPAQSRRRTSKPPQAQTRQRPTRTSGPGVPSTRRFPPKRWPTVRFISLSVVEQACVLDDEGTTEEFVG